MKPLTALSTEVARNIRGLLFDLDDTVLSYGVLTRAAFDAIWKMHDAGLRLVAVTGRPSGWGEVLARQWPIDGAVTENGAVHVYRSGMAMRVLEDGTPSEIAQRRARLAALVAVVAEKLPRAKLADDNHARRSDVTWDIGENDHLPPDVVDELAQLVLTAGARTTRSSVHLHATFERDDKASGVMRFLHARFGDDVGSAMHRYAFVGDSSNDAACFSAFRTTFGVANVRNYVRSLTVPPAFVSPSDRGAGFAEIVDALLAARQT